MVYPVIPCALCGKDFVEAARRANQSAILLPNYSKPLTRAVRYPPRSIATETSA